MTAKAVNAKAMTAKPIPQIGEILKFYDDGKTGYSRRYWAKVIRIVPMKDAERVILKDIPEYDDDDNLCYVERTLVQQWEIEKQEAEWIYAVNTDFFIECQIPSYDNYTIWFARMKQGGWFSMNVQNFWQGGLLDVDNTWYPEDPDEPYTYWDKTWEDDLAHPYKKIENES